MMNEIYLILFGSPSPPGNWYNTPATPVFNASVAAWNASVKSGNESIGDMVRMFFKALKHFN